MAVWQYQLSIIPKSAILEKYGEIPEKLFIDEKAWIEYWNNVHYKDGFPEPDFVDGRTIKWWINTNLDIPKAADQIDKLVTRGDWSNDKDFIGWKGDTQNEEDHDCHIAFDEKTNRIEEFQFRTDLRNRENAIFFINGMLGICEQYDLIVMNTKGYLFEPNLELIINDLRKSDAIKFLTNPQKFLEEISKNDEYRFNIQTKKKGFWKRIIEFLN